MAISIPWLPFLFDFFVACPTYRSFFSYLACWFLLAIICLLDLSYSCSFHFAAPFLNVLSHQYSPFSNPCNLFFGTLSYKIFRFFPSFFDCLLFPCYFLGYNPRKYSAFSSHFFDLSFLRSGGASNLKAIYLMLILLLVCSYCSFMNIPLFCLFYLGHHPKKYWKNDGIPLDVGDGTLGGISQ